MQSCGGSGGLGAGGRGTKFQLAAEHATVAAAAGDALSDSESEDEEDDTPMPTPADARTVFDGEASQAEGRDSSSGNEEASAQIDEGRGRVSRARERGGFARDDAIAALEGARRAKRIQDAERLADRMHAIGAEVRFAGFAREDRRFLNAEVGHARCRLLFIGLLFRMGSLL